MYRFQPCKYFRSNGFRRLLSNPLRNCCNRNKLCRIISFFPHPDNFACTNSINGRYTFLIIRIVATKACTRKSLVITFTEIFHIFLILAGDQNLCKFRWFHIIQIILCFNRKQCSQLLVSNNTGSLTCYLVLSGCFIHYRCYLIVQISEIKTITNGNICIWRFYHHFTYRICFFLWINSVFCCSFD